MFDSLELPVTFYDPVRLALNDDLIGITPSNAYDWARLAARDWSGYIAQRAR